MYCSLNLKYTCLNEKLDKSEPKSNNKSLHAKTQKFANSTKGYHCELIYQKTQKKEQ